MNLTNVQPTKPQLPELSRGVATSQSSHLGKRASSLSKCADRSADCAERVPPPQSEMLWLRLAMLCSGPQRLAYLEKALQINPNNKQTLRLLERICPQRAREVRVRLGMEEWER